MLLDGCKILTCFSCIDENFFCSDAGCQRLSYTSGFKKHLYAPIGLNKYFVKKAPTGAYKCFLKPDVYDNLWHPASEQKKFSSIHEKHVKILQPSRSIENKFH